jgi:hypothetical protein
MTDRLTEVWHWRCDCGAEGHWRTKERSLAGLVRAVRRRHRNCPDPDINRLESSEQRERRLLEERKVHDPEFF